MKISNSIINIADNKYISLTENLWNYKDVLNEIAEELAYNYIMNSFGDKEKNQVLIEEILNLGNPSDKLHFSEMKDEITNRIKDNQRCRNIIVMGAGASHEAYPAIPLGSEMTEAFRREYAEALRNLPFIENKFLAEVHEVEKLNKFGLDFENFFQILSNYVGQGELRNKIKDYTGFKYAPCLLNEIVAHLLKHSFIDAVINFNFDELLDNAIDDEIGENNYRKVVSDGDCLSLDELIVDGRLKVPLYIKPHGTFSHPSSLKFTKKQYLDISTGIENILIQLLGGYRGYDESASGSNEAKVKNKEIDRINLILIGFNLASVEFNTILEKNLPVYSKIYHLQWGNDNTNQQEYLKDILPGFYEKVKYHFINAPETNNEIPNEDYRREKKIYHSIAVKDFNKGTQKNQITKPYAEIMTVIWRLTHYRFKIPYQPRSISRHEIISYFFEGYAPSKSLDINKQRTELKNKYDNSRTFFLDRVIVEIAIALSRNDGIVDTVELLLHRVGTFYAHYTRICENKSFKTQKIYSIYEILRYFAVLSTNNPTDQFMYSDNIFQLAGLNCKKFSTFIESQKNKSSEDTTDELKKYYTIIGKKFNKLKPKKQFKENHSEIEELSKTNSLVFHLLAHPLLSKRFKINFVKRCHQKVHNSLFFQTGQQYLSNTLFDEVIRSFEKSSKMHYYHIQPKYFDPKNLLWETFSKKNISHTNLSFKYKFWELFNNKGSELNHNWDIFLSILELGSILEFIKKTNENNGTKVSHESNSKNIILLCSNESSRQKYQTATEENFRERHIEELSLGYNLNILYMPYSQHNNHVNLFLKRLEITTENDIEKLRKNFRAVEFKYKKDNKEESVFFEVVGSLYVHRRGFSNSINPINISGDNLSPIKYEGLGRDNKKLLSLFFNNFCRAISFENALNKSINSPIATSWQDTNILTGKIIENIKEIENFASWTSREYHERMNTFFYNLHKSL